MTAPGIPALLEPIQERLDAVGKAQNTRVDSTVLDGAVFRSQSDTARLLAAVKAVEALHKPYAICDPCECTDHPEEYEYIDCGEYNGCERTITAWACGECCSDAMWFNTEECATNHRHTMNKDERCPTVSAVEAALRNEA